MIFRHLDKFINNGRLWTIIAPSQGKYLVRSMDTEKLVSEDWLRKSVFITDKMIEEMYEKQKSEAVKMVGIGEK